MEFLNQDCKLTLREGLDELYRHNPEVESVSNVNGKIFTDHDLTHVIFGCDTSIIGEIMLKPWILLGCNISMAELKEYAGNPEVQKLNKEGEALLGGKFLTIVKIVFYYTPQFFWIWFTHVRKMSRKWPHSTLTNEMMNTRICDLRADYNISVLN
jgi:hypothetical protein